LLDATREPGIRQLYPIAELKSDGTPTRTLAFTIEVTDEGTITGPPFRLRGSFTNWRAIGRIVFDNAAVSLNGDAVLHFNHPTWRADRHDPKTATRVNGRKVVP
jgi:hypothetical protein